MRFHHHVLVACGEIAYPPHLQEAENFPEQVFGVRHVFVNLVADDDVKPVRGKRRARPIGDGVRVNAYDGVEPAAEMFCDEAATASQVEAGHAIQGQLVPVSIVGEYGQDFLRFFDPAGFNDPSVVFIEVGKEGDVACARVQSVIPSQSFINDTGFQKIDFKRSRLRFPLGDSIKIAWRQDKFVKISVFFFPCRAVCSQFLITSGFLAFAEPTL